MAKYTSVLHQLLRHIPRDEFRAIVERHQGDKGVRKLSCWGQFVALFFGQLTGQHSLRDLVTTLDAGRKKLQQVGRGAGAAPRWPMRTANGRRRSSGSCLAACTSAVGVRLRVSVSPSGIECTVWMRR